jgi:hypothetical protein
MPGVIGPSRRTLDDVPQRVFTFVLAVVEVPAIRAALATKGYTAEEHAYAWERLARLAIVGPKSAPVLVNRVARDAVDELNAWDEPNFACIKATLDRLHPEQSAFVFHNLEPKQGPEAVLGVGLLLDRLDDLENSPDRLATRDQDHAALATLAQRGYTAQERARLRELVNLTKNVAGSVAPLSNEERTVIVEQLYAWLTDWSTYAKTVITRRDHLIRLGLAKRKKGAGKRKDGNGTTDSTGSVPAGAPGTGTHSAETQGAGTVAVVPPSAGANGAGTQGAGTVAAGAGGP